MRWFCWLLLAGILLGHLKGQGADWLDEVQGKVLEGNDRRALELLRRGLRAEPDLAQALRVGVEVALNGGAYLEADRWSRALISHQEREGIGREDLLLRARTLRTLARRREALALLHRFLKVPLHLPPDAPAFDFEAVALGAALEREIGQREKAKELYDRLVREAQRVVIREPRDLVALAQAYRFFGGVKEAAQALAGRGGALRKDPDYLPARLALGDLYRSWGYQLPKNAVAEYRLALKIRKGLGAALEGMGRAYEIWQKEEKASRAYSRALRINPKNGPVLAALARLELMRHRRRKGSKLLARVLKLWPAEQEALGVKGALMLLQGDQPGFEAFLAATWQEAAAKAEALRIAGAVLDRYWRWKEALVLLRRAVALNPARPRLWDERARLALYLGLEKEGLEALREADARAPFGSPWRDNTWLVQGLLKRHFKTIASAHFIQRVPETEMAGLGQYVGPFAERSYRLLSKKYHFTPQGLESRPGKILVEHFSRHEDFAVRTVGLKGLGIQGVCFGPFIAEDSPAAKIPGYSWYRTLHHEITHTMTLGVSKNRVPRWFTEGLSTYEEFSLNPAWERRLDRQLFDAWRTDNLLSVEGFDAAFQTGRVLFAYFQAGVVCQMIVKEFGFPSILEMLAAYGEGLSTEAVFQRALKLTTKAFDLRFKAFVGLRVAPIRLIPRLAESQFKALLSKVDKGQADHRELVLCISALLDRKQPLDAQEVLLAARKKRPADPALDFLQGRMAFQGGRLEEARVLLLKASKKGFQNHDLHMLLASLHEKKGEGALEQRELEAALKDFPARHGRGDPRLALARLAAARGDAARALRLREEHLRLDFADIKLRQSLVSWYQRHKDHQNALRHLKALLLLTPDSPQLHLDLGRELLETGEPKPAVKEYRVAVGLTRDEAKGRAFVALARALWKGLNDTPGALTALEQALQLSPELAEALSLQKKIREGHRP